MLNIKKILKGLRLLNDVDQTKAVEITPASASTTSTKTIINVQQTGNRTLSTPLDSLSGELLTTTSVQSINGKTIVVANNTVTTTASGNLVATELNAALAELQADIDTRSTQVSLNNHINNTTGAHAASAISVVPTGNLLSTNVQSALNELQSDFDGIGTFATQALNNLMSTAVNANITPGVGGSIDLGENLKRWRHTYSVDLTGSRAFLNNIQIGYEPTLPSGGISTATITSAGADNLYLMTPNSALFASTSLNLETGNALGVNPSGNIILRTGSVATGTRGSLVIDASILKRQLLGVEVLTEDIARNIGLTSNTSNETITSLTQDITAYRSLIISYTVSIGAVRRVGTLHITCSTTNAAIADSYVESNVTSLSFSADVSTGLLRIRQTNTEVSSISLSYKLLKFKE